MVLNMKNKELLKIIQFFRVFLNLTEVHGSPLVKAHTQYKLTCGLAEILVI